ncbi:rhodanese-like domain-containing protein [Actinokineospora sp. NPDC004072]
MTAVHRIPPAAPEVAAAHFAARLAVETDVSDVHADLEAGVPGLVVVDSRSAQSWEQGRVPGALHLPTAEIADRAAAEIPLSSLVVTYCWGPGCNGATRAALEFARRGYRVKEMIGGFEYWAREGLPVERADGVTRGAVDLLVAPSGSACAC